MQKRDVTSEQRLEAVEREIARWRRKRSGGRMPNELWQMAAEVAVGCGVEVAAERLKLDASRVKDWMDRLGLEEIAENRPTFVELLPPTNGFPAECIVQWEQRSGRKVRISLKGQATTQLLALGEMLWRDPT